MFANLKNKIKEEIGSDVSTVVRNAGTVRNVPTRQHSQTGSTSSISGSQISLDDSREENPSSPMSPIYLNQENNFEFKLKDGTPLSAKDVKRLESREDEWRKRLLKKESEFIKKMEKKEEEFRIKIFEKDKELKKILDKHEKDKSKLIEEKLRSEDERKSLQIALNNAEEYKKKLYNFQESAEQLEGYQSQEMAKIKHLLLSKEQEVEEKSNRLKTAVNEIENYKAEILRLRRYEDELNNIQDEMESLRHSTQKDKSQLSSQLAQSEEEVRHLKEKVFVLEQRIALNSNDQVTVDEQVANLMRERTLLERKLEEAHLHLSDIKTSWSGKISSLETQVGRLSRQAGEEGLERRRVEKEKEILQKKIKTLESEIEVNHVVIAKKDAKLLRMAEDIDEMATELKELRSSVDDEVEEFKREIEQSSKQVRELEIQLEEMKNILNKKENELFNLQETLTNSKSEYISLKNDISSLREELEAEKQSKLKIGLNLEKEKNEKDSAFLRNALISQEIQLAKLEIKKKEQENSDLQNQLIQMQKLLVEKTKDIEAVKKKLDEALKKGQDFESIKLETKNLEGNEKILKTSLLDLEEQLNEKNKTIRVLQQRLVDMKKTLQQELLSHPSENDSDNAVAILNPSSSKTVNVKQTPKEDDVNFLYLKHVIMKFLTSREYEALNLTKAVATLLHLTVEEEKLLQETLEWKMSWFGTKPNLGFGQTAKAIPPS